jgi:hypothetical protein
MMKRVENRRSRLPVGLLVWLAVFSVAQADVTTNTWSYTGSWANAAANWTNTAYWSAGHAPLAGEAAVVSGSVMLTNSTEALYSYTLNAGKTNMFAGTNAILIATNVTIYGVISHMTNSATTTNAAGEWVMDSRVWIVCTNLLVATNAQINAAEKGYVQVAATNDGYGPGGGKGQINAPGRGAGGGHGGAGGNADIKTGGGTYGVSNAPVEPGSAGGAGQAVGGFGGGAVRIDADDVTVDGTIDASGGHENGSGNHMGGGGSGGSVYINCRLLRGTGAVRADGGNGGQYSAQPYSGGGGGGRIAVICNSGAQSAVTPPSSVQFSAKRGLGGYQNGGLGTVYLSSMELLSRGTLTGGGQFMVPNLTAWTWTNNLVCTNCEIVFPAGLRLTVTNDMILSGTSAILTLTNVALTVTRDLSVTGTTSRLWIYCDTNTVSVGRNLTVDRAGKVYIYAGASNGLPPYYAALVSVGGDLTIGTNANLSPYSQPTTNGGSLKFAVRNLTVAAGGIFYACGTGYATTNGFGPGFGPGGGKMGAQYTGGGGHGGKGGDAWNSAGTGGDSYGSSNAPVTCGSAGGSNSGFNEYGGAGGGLVWVEAAGRILVDGSISASGTNGNNRGGAGAGGGIYLVCRRFGGGGTLWAKGGIVPGAGVGGGGGGGRIAVWRSFDSWNGTPASDTMGTAVDGGSSGFGKTGVVGTVYWGLLPMSGTVLTVK